MVENPSFEEPGTEPGTAQGWTLITSVAAERIVGFGPEPVRAWEDFERWGPLWRALSAVGTTRAFFNAATDGVELLERGWDNDAYQRAFPASAVPHPFADADAEGFDRGVGKRLVCAQLDRRGVRTGAV